MPSHQWLDISVGLEEGVVTWPDDPAFKLSRLANVDTDGVEVSEVRMSVHTGTHIDAPAHYVEGGGRIGAMPIDTTVGPCVVVTVPDHVREIKAEHLEPLELTVGERVLFRTGNSARHLLHRKAFAEDYAFIGPEAARFLARLPVRCVGVDYLSVGGPGELGVQTHRILLSSGIWVIEGLDLAHVDPGPYELVCLPLRMINAEGAPARAVLQALSGRRRNAIEFIDDAVEWASKMG